METTGGIIGADWIRTLAIAANVGIDVKWMLEMDPLARDLIIDVVQKAVEYADNRDRNMALKIVEELGNALK
jgi:hypothetical protein